MGSREVIFDGGSTDVNQNSGIMSLTNNDGKTGRAGSPLPAERVGWKAAARTE